jgi:uncharacterized protein
MIMKRINSTFVSSLFSLLIVIISLSSCNNSHDMTYRTIRKTIDQVRVINTHEHQHRPEEFGDYDFGFYHLLATTYLSSDIRSAGVFFGNMDELDTLNPDILWERYGEGLDHSRNTSYYNHFVKGLQKLYGFNDLYFTRENTRILDEQIRTNYRNYGTWLDSAFKTSGFDLMFNDQYWNPFNCDLDERYFALVFHVNPLVMQASERPEEGEENQGLYRYAYGEGFDIRHLDDYLDFCDHQFKKNMENQVVCVKNSMAYSRSLDYEDIPYEEAKRLFDRPADSLTPGEAKKIQDFMFHWVIKRSIEYDLPIQIHTGYLAGNGNALENGKPSKLNNLFLQYPEAKFVLFHGGYPWTGEYAAYGKMFPNVYLDIVWLPQISREHAIIALDEMLDTVPYNKFFWGGDCALIEESAGSLEYGKDVLAEVLTQRVNRGLMSMEVAGEIALGMFRNNAIKVFQLEKKLAGRAFSDRQNLKEELKIKN